MHALIVMPLGWVITKMVLLFGMNYCQCLIITTRVPLEVNIIVKRLDINVALGILGWDGPLFE